MLFHFGIISAPVSIKVPMWSSGFCAALEAKEKLLRIINVRLMCGENGFSVILNTSIPFPDTISASQHLLLFISALIPKALASLLTSFTLALSGTNKLRR
ncbi:hypothetical protein AOXY_G2134 [Acipenser oxyrinchus oxyrinchus]|uniref:Uncharacterized protein n=1 Tax=Acipenser oxyrinchus oxyrinchus TaxID=40147 RepID=A0AAD8LS98_ACIOX|nr:hypothetical protein AOXY_G2134 [Acipenser oxyrinchus oxyrinchus]